MQKRAAAALIRRHGRRGCMTRVVSLLLCFVVAASAIAQPFVAHASDFTDLIAASAKDWLAGWTGQNTGVWNPVDPLMGFFTLDSSGKNVPATVNKSQKYYTTPTSSVVDKSGNVTNYYRGGDTTDMKIIDSYNKTFNTIHNTTNNTNNYQANVKLSDFLNQYTTNNVTNKYTYSADFKSWYYDNTTNNYNYNQFTKNDYTQNNLYYNQDNSRYYISIDNSTDEYYLVDVQYSPTFVTVNYTYNTTNINNEKVGDVTNVYYYELKDGRNSSTLTVNEISGLDINYDVANYDLVTDDPNTLSLQHFDGDYTDSSSFNRSFYSENRSMNYVDSGAFGKAVSLPSGAAAGVTIPNLSGYDSLSFDFRVYYNDIASLKVYFGDSCILQKIPDYRSWSGSETYSDNGNTDTLRYLDSNVSSWQSLSVNGHYSVMGSYSTTISSSSGIPSSSDSPGYIESFSSDSKVGILKDFAVPIVHARKYTRYDNCYAKDSMVLSGRTTYYAYFERINKATVEYRSVPEYAVIADFAYDSYKNQWLSMRITLSGGNIYYFVNGDLVGSGSFTKPTADKFYIKSSGTIYLDELRVTTGSLSSTGAYTPSSSPFDTNKVLALPDELTDNTIYVQHNTNVTNCRIGGVRPSNPIIGFLYIPLHDDRTAAQPQLYDGSNWIDVTAMVHNGDTTVNVLGYKFSPVGDSPDVNVDAKPEHPTKPVDPETCTHEWEETDRTEPTCILAGTVEYTCSKCEKTKTETLPKLGHTWEVKQSVQTSYDEEGNVLTQGFTIYRCSTCGEEYKDSNGSGPPGGGGGTGGDDDKSIWDRIADLVGAVVGGLLDGLVSLANMLLGKLADVVSAIMSFFTEIPKLFEGFLGFLSAVFPFFPPEIMLLLTFGIAAVVFIGIIKALRR